MKIIVMGVSGSGKTTVGEQIGAALGITYIDGDDLHPEANIEKMRAGTPLTDADRAPWLCEIGQRLAAHPTGLLIGSSALKRSYRDIIRREVQSPVFFLHLDGSRDLIAQRLNSRQGHFWPPALIDSQFATLEALDPDESGAVIQIDQPVAALTEAGLAALRVWADQNGFTRNG